MLQDYVHKAERKAKRGALALTGVALTVVGAGFLTHAAWLLMADLRDPLFAAQVIGGVYVLAGGAMLIASRHAAESSRAAEKRPLDAMKLAEAFLVGMDAASGRTRRND